MRHLQKNRWQHLVLLFTAIFIASAGVILSFVTIDPVVYQFTRALEPQTRDFFRSFTDLGKSEWSLIPASLMIAFLLFKKRQEIPLKTRVILSYWVFFWIFIFVSVAGSGLTVALVKNSLGRARPKLFDQLGPIDFTPLAFTPDFASFPSGHATCIFALAAAIALFFPRAKSALFVTAALIASTRFLIGVHYLSDVIVGALYGTSFSYWVRYKFATKRWLFEKKKDDKIVLRGTQVIRQLSKKTEG